MEDLQHLSYHANYFIFSYDKGEKFLMEDWKQSIDTKHILGQNEAK